MLGLLVLGLIAVVVALPLLARQGSAMWGAAAKRRHARAVAGGELRYDPGRERRAEQRARELLRSCVNDEEWAMYRDLGFLRVYGGSSTGRGAGRAARRGTDPAASRGSGSAASRGSGSAASRGLGSAASHGDALGHDLPTPRDTAVPRGFSMAGGASTGDGSERDALAGETPRDTAPYAYLVYAHKPIVAFVPATSQFLSEYCVEFPDIHGEGRTRLPASDDVLAKWMALTSDESRVIGTANMHLVGRQHDPSRLRRDLWRLSEWERRRGAEDDSVSARG